MTQCIRYLSLLTLLMAIAGCTTWSQGVPSSVNVTRPSLGVRVRVTKAQSFTPSLPMGWSQALLVVRVVPESPAAVAGLRPGDVVLTVDGQPVTSSVDSLSILRRHHAGDILPVTAWQRGVTRELQVKLN